jgi:hypothetical protein
MAMDSAAREEHQTLWITLPDDVTIGDLKAVKGSLMDAASVYIDWDLLRSGAPDAISAPGRVLLAIVERIPSQ